MNDEKATTTTTAFGARGAKAPTPSGIEENPSPSKALKNKLSPRIFRLSYGPEEEEERKEALTLAHIRVVIFVSNLRISVFNREQDTEY